jgi:hypothetical protein
MNFGKWRNAVAILQYDSVIEGDRHLNNRHVPSDETNMLNGAFWAEVFPTRHVKPILPEMLARLDPNQVMPIAESIHDFHLLRLQCSQSFRIARPVSGTPGTG